MKSRTLLLNHPEHLNRGEIARHITRRIRPDPKEADAWAVGVFKLDPDEDCQTRLFAAFGTLKDCADAVAGCLTRKPKLPSPSRLRLLFAQCDTSEIECRSNDLCF